MVRVPDTGGATSIFAGPTNLSNPIGIGLDNAGGVYVVNNASTGPNANSVARYSPTGVAQGFFVPTVPMTLNAPVNIAFDAAGNAYVTNDGNPALGSPQFIQKYNAAGVSQGNFGATTNVPTGIGFDRVNGQLYVSNSGTTGVNANSISIYNPANLSMPPSSPPPVRRPGQPPADRLRRRRQRLRRQLRGDDRRLERQGIHLRGGVPPDLHPEREPGRGAEGVAVDPAGNVYVSLLNRGTVEKFSANGTDLGPIASGFTNVAYIQYQAVPEPGSLALAAVALAGAAGYRLCRRKRTAGRAA